MYSAARLAPLLPVRRPSNASEARYVMCPRRCSTSGVTAGIDFCASAALHRAVIKRKYGAKRRNCLGFIFPVPQSTQQDGDVVLLRKRFIVLHGNNVGKPTSGG